MFGGMDCAADAIENVNLFAGYEERISIEWVML
jgi:hypothetical protein